MKLRIDGRLLVGLGAALFAAACSPEGTCQLQGVCPNLGPNESYDNCCAVAGDCTYRFTDGHTVGPYAPGSFEEAQAALDEAMAYCLAEGDTGADTDTSDTDPSDTDTDDTDLSAGGVVVTVDGVRYSLPYGYCASTNCGASDGTGGPGSSGVGLYAPMTLGTHTCTEGQSLPALVFTYTDSNGQPSAWGVGAAFGVGSGSCTITLTAIGTRSGERIEGTFSGTLPASNGATPAQRILTDGRFSLPIQ